LSGVVEFQILVDDIQTGNAIGLLHDGRAITCEGTSSNPEIIIKPNGKVQKGSGNGNTVEAYVKLIHASNGIAWSLPRARKLSKCFTQAFILHEVAEATIGCFTTTCENCTCPDGTLSCKTINEISFEDVEEQCAPPSCNDDEYIRGFRRPACVYEIFVVDESSSMVE
ncbi:hypothetical protein, partial [Salmonella sp. s51228]|uniref:hypothetical protein n=1 Tax=Salmonella sp. s51228 TaxID=3159652 RepID=UPI00397F1D64